MEKSQVFHNENASEELAKDCSGLEQLQSQDRAQSFAEISDFD